MKVAEFAAVRGIDEKPASSWCITCTLLRCDRIISTVNKCIKIMSYNCDEEVPASIEHTYKIDSANGNHLLYIIINREMEDLKVAFDILH